MHIESIVTVLVVGFFVIITPGPNMAVVIKNTISGNTFSGIFTSIGLALGNLVHITYCLIGIGLIISKSIIIFNIIKILGAIYLIYLGIMIIKSKQKIYSENIKESVSKKSVFKCLLNGFITDLLNPKATLFFLSLFTQIIKADSTILERIFCGALIAILEVLCFSILSIIIGNQIVKRMISRMIPIIEKITGILLILLGIRIIFTGSSK
jgi:RhtB (resistance to homoserine/threonine) family protein